MMQRNLMKQKIVTPKMIKSRKVLSADFPHRIGRFLYKFAGKEIAGDPVSKNTLFSDCRLNNIFQQF